MPNECGINASTRTNGERPPDHILYPLLVEWNGPQALPRRVQLEKLSKMGWHIKGTKLGKTLNEYNIPTVRKSTRALRNNIPLARSLVSQTMTRLGPRNGPETVLASLKANDNVYISRDLTRKLVDELSTPEEKAKRYPGRSKPSIPCGSLRARALFQEIHCDGHEKFNKQALRMGDASLPIYHFKCQTGPELDLRCIPDDRHALVVAHLYLDMIEQEQAIPVQLTMDKGSETGQMWAQQEVLRLILRPSWDPEQFPPCLAMKSVHNQPAEVTWRWMTQQGAEVLKSHILEGRMNGVFNPNNDIHMNLFRWLWPKIVQIQLDKFKRMANYREPRKQKDKQMPNGMPQQIYEDPARFGYEDWRIYVPQLLIDALRARLPPRASCLRWVEPEFNHVAQEVYQQIGQPLLNDASTGWWIFSEMRPRIEAYIAMNPLPPLDLDVDYENARPLTRTPLSLCSPLTHKDAACGISFVFKQSPGQCGRCRVVQLHSGDENLGLESIIQCLKCGEIMLPDESEVEDLNDYINKACAGCSRIETLVANLDELLENSREKAWFGRMNYQAVQGVGRVDEYTT